MSAAFILATAFTVPAKKQSAKFNSMEDGKYSMSFSKIVIEDDIDVMLHESAEKNILVEGWQGDVANVEWKVKNGVLYVSSKTGSLKGRVLVTVDVSGLKKIDINGASEVKSLGNLNSGSLYISMNGFGLVSIVNAGKIELVNGEGISLDVKKKTANVHVSQAGV